MGKQETEENQVGGNAKSGKRLYEKPAFRYERVFETSALSCGKIGVNQRQCQGNRKTS
jgi:hypothetical protein